MYTLLAQQSAPAKFAIQQLPAFGTALVIAEIWYKLGSFSLECVAFLGTWFLIDFAVSSVQSSLFKS